MYRYHRDTDTDVGGYNITRHAGVTMSLEQAAGAALTESDAAATAERGIEWALDRMYAGPGWSAFAGDGDGRFGSGASALLTAALVLRRERTRDELAPCRRYRFGHRRSSVSELQCVNACTTKFVPRRKASVDGRSG